MSEAMCSCSPAPPSMEEEDSFSREGIPLLPTSSPSMAAAPARHSCCFLDSLLWSWRRE